MRYHQNKNDSGFWCVRRRNLRFHSILYMLFRSGGIPVQRALFVTKTPLGVVVDELFRYLFLLAST